MEKSTTATAAKNQQRANKRAEKKAAKAEEKAAAETAAAAEVAAAVEAKSKKLSVKVDTLLEKVQEFFPEAKSSQDYTTGQPNGVKIFINGETIFSITFFYLENKLNVVFTFDTKADADEISSFLTKLKHKKALFMTKKDLETGVIFAATVKEVLKFFYTIDNCIAVIHELIAPPRSIAAPVTDRTFAPTHEPIPSEASGKAPASTAASSSVAAGAPWKLVMTPAQAPVAVTSAPSKSSFGRLENLKAQKAAIIAELEKAQTEAETQLQAEIQSAQVELALKLEALAKLRT